MGVWGTSYYFVFLKGTHRKNIEKYDNELSSQWVFLAARRNS